MFLLLVLNVLPMVKVLHFLWILHSLCE
ncbi:hypothetical protein F383_36686 [Gossypium arboreum]|uniref:Uncharacterized protein n=1 Tax=Gossypium arboreum TaxID=29729 RepID=A0A0B0M5N2_GOSAR|nr:hypothetical protein F383_36686 [Gossypium arboreum]